jgi:hypothetical protein
MLYITHAALFILFTTIGCGSTSIEDTYNGFTATNPPTGESVIVAQALADHFGDPAIFSRIMNTNLTYVHDRFDYCPTKSHACTIFPNIYLERQDTYFTQCFLYTHEFIHIAMSILHGDADAEHMGLGHGLSDYESLSTELCAAYKSIPGNPFKEGSDMK